MASKPYTDMSAAELLAAYVEWSIGVRQAPGPSSAAFAYEQLREVESILHARLKGGAAARIAHLEQHRDALQATNTELLEANRIYKSGLRFALKIDSECGRLYFLHDLIQGTFDAWPEFAAGAASPAPNAAEAKDNA